MSASNVPKPQPKTEDPVAKADSEPAPPAAQADARAGNEPKAKKEAAPKKAAATAGQYPPPPYEPPAVGIVSDPHGRW
jgi:hypothetical protein